MGEQIARRAARGATHLMVRRVASNLLRIGALAILARTLAPAEFGIAALANVLLMFIVVVGSSGVGVFVIYDREDGWEERANSAFWLSGVLLAVQAAVALAVVDLVTGFYDESELRDILLALIAVYVVEQQGAIPNALLRRQLRFGTIAARDFGADVLTQTMSIVLALNGYGVWSLIIPRLVVSPVVVLLSFVFARWAPRLVLGVSSWGRILRYTLSVMGTSIVHRAAQDLDTLLVGKFFGAAALGVYNIAYQLSNFVGRNLSVVVSDVGMPALAKVGERPERLTSAYLRFTRFLAFVSIPMLLGMFAVADDLVLLVYGPKWTSAVTLLRIFIVFTVVRSISSISGVLFQVVGRPDLSFKLTFALAVVQLGAMWVGSYYGLGAMAAAIAATRVASGLIALTVASSLLGVTLRTLLATVLPSAAAAILMAAGAWSLTQTLSAAEVVLPVRFAIAVVAGMCLYPVAVALLHRRALRETEAAIADVSAPLGRVTHKINDVLCRLPSFTR